MKRVIIIVIVLVAALMTLYIYLRGARDRRLMHRGGEIVVKIEEFRSQKKRLPNSLRDFGIVDESELFYTKWDSVNYFLWYGTNLGESMTYYSDSKGWEEGDRVPK